MGRHRKPSSHNTARFVAIAATGSLGVISAAGIAAADSGHIWTGVANCESSGDWSANTGNGFYGGLQFTQSTWDAYKPEGAPARADLASPDQQIQAAESTLTAQGPGAWPVCGQYLTEGAAVAPDPVPVQACLGWVWPVDASISQGFSGSHDGIDIAGSMGQAISAATSGTITIAGFGNDPGGYGNYIEQLADTGEIVQYGHVSEIYVSPGEYVEAGRIIGAVGNAGSSTGPHLHLRIHNANGPADPTSYLGSYCAESAPAPAEQVPAPEPEAPGAHSLTHEVVSGDTLSGIAAQSGRSWQDLWELNPHIADPNLIYPGDLIYL